MSIENQVKILVNLAPLVPYVALGIKEALAVYNRIAAGLKDGVSDEEMASAVTEADAVLDRIIAKTELGVTEPVRPP